MWLTKLIYYKLLGWKLAGGFDPKVKKCVVTFYPHTSWHDFYIGAFARKLYRTQINFVGKQELFSWPVGAYFRWMGGVPIDRTPGQNKVEAIAKIFESKDEFRLALSPEGTRKKVDQWKTGFYYIALAAKVPIVPVSFDFGTKTTTAHPPFYPSGEIEEDLKILRAIYAKVVGKNPDKM